MIERRPRYTLRKLSVGLASVMVGSVLFLTNSPEVHAETGNGDLAITESSSVEEKSTSVNDQEDTNKDKTDVSEATKVETTENVTNGNVSDSKASTQENSNNGAVADKAEAPVSTENKSQTQTKLASSTEATDKKSDPDDFKVPEAASDNQHIINKGAKHDEPFTNKKGKLWVWISANGKDGKEYNSGLIGNNSEVDIAVNEIDLDSLAYNLVFEDINGENTDPGLYTLMNSKVATYGDIEIAKKLSGDQVSDFEIKDYTGDADRINLYSVKVNPGDKLRLKAKINYKSNGSLTFIPGAGTYYYAVEGYDSLLNNVKISFVGNTDGDGKTDTPTIPPDEPKDDPAIPSTITVDKPSVSMTDKRTDTNPLLYEHRDDASLDKNGEWLDISAGKVAGYLKMTGNDGKEYYTKYVNNNDNKFILDTTRFDPNSLELVIVYKQGDTDKNPLLWFSIGNAKGLSVDKSRINSETGIQVEDSENINHDLKYMLPSKGGWYWNYKDFLTSGDDLGDVKNFYLNDSGYKPGETLKVTIPLKYTVSFDDTHLEDRNNITIRDYNSWKSYDSEVTFAKPLYRLSDIDWKLAPAVYGRQIETNNQQWILQPELEKILDDAGLTFKDIFVDDPFNTYAIDYQINKKPRLNIDPKDNFDIVYSAGGYIFMMRKIQDVISKHGYSIQFAKSNDTGEYEVMPYYLFTKKGGAHIFDEAGNQLDGKGEITKDDRRYFSVIPTILVNPDLHYTVGDKVKDVDGNETTIWDPLAEGKPSENKDALLKAYNDAGYDSFKQRKPGDFFGVREEATLTALNPRGGDTQADSLTKNPGLTVTIVYQKDKDSQGELVDKVDLTKAGIYTVTYSRVFFGPEKQPDNSLINLIAIDNGKQGEMILNQGKVYVNASETEEKKVSRTVNFVEAGNESHVLHDPVTQEVTFAREKTTDAETGEVSYSDWKIVSENTKFEKLTVPEITGYTPDQTEIPELTVAEDSKDVVVTVKYTKAETPVTPDNPTDPVNPATDNPATPDSDNSKPDANHTPVTPDQDTTTEETDYLKVNDPKHNEHETSKDKTSTNHEKVKLEKKQKGTGFVKGANKEKVKDKANVAQNTANQLPQTGESENNLAVMGLAIIESSLVALAGLFMNRKKD